MNKGIKIRRGVQLKRMSLLVSEESYRYLRAASAAKRLPMAEVVDAILLRKADKWRESRNLTQGGDSATRLQRE